MNIQRFPCGQCGAELEFKPGTSHLECSYCGHEEIIPASEEEIHELDFHSYAEHARLDMGGEQDQILRCNECGAEYSIGGYDSSDACPFCGANVVVPVDPIERVAPKSLLPFALDQREARDSYRKWIGSRFWAPNNLKKRARASASLHGVYVPFWTYDSLTHTWYTGMRGIDYYVTETYRVNGETRTRRVRKTRWYPASGHVVVPFDDVLILGTQRLPRKYTEMMQAWELEGLEPYSTDYLSGFQAMRYDIDLEGGFVSAKEIMDGEIHSAVCRDIGGDRQRVHSKSTQYDRLTFKHILLPIYSGAYRYKEKTYRFFINGQSGQTAGEAPVSFWKVALAVLIGLAIIAAAVYFFGQSEG
jgi:DNA-directed RNA polymerase subunit RPC12/RpoP